MALDIQIPYRGDQYLFQGISGGAAGLASGAEALTKRFRQIQDAGKAADYYVKADPEALMRMGVHEDEWKTLGARDKAAAIQGLMEKGAMERLTAQNEAAMAEAQDRKAQAAERTGMAASMNALPALMGKIRGYRQDSGTAPTGADVDPGQEMDPNAMMSGAGPNVQTGPPTSDELMRAIAEMGPTNPRLAAQLTKTLLPQIMGQGGSDPMSFMEDPSTGQRFAVKGKQVLPSGINPAKRQEMMKAQPITDEQGNVLAHALTDPKGKTTFLKPNGGALTAKDRATLRQKYAALHVNLLNAQTMAGSHPETKAIYDDAIAKNEADMKALEEPEPASAVAKPAAASAAPLELPKTAEELKKDQVYNTKRGPAKWDGKQFNLMK